MTQTILIFCSCLIMYHLPIHCVCILVTFYKKTFSNTNHLVVVHGDYCTYDHELVHMKHLNSVRYHTEY